MKPIITIFFVVTLLGCTTKTKEEKSAEQFCNCAEGYANKVQDLTNNFSKMSNMTEEKVTEMTIELQKYTDSLNACTEKYKTELADQKVLQAIKVICPTTAQQFAH